MQSLYLQAYDYDSRFRILKGRKISLVVSALLVGTTLLYAAPSGGVITSGSAAISQSGSITNIDQSSQKASINWTTFSIGSTETVNFNQPNSSAITLNRVIGNEKSIINGALNANGQVWILNSNGVLFGKNASVNTAGLLATTKFLSDADFQKGNYTFKGDSKESIINQGSIDIANSGYATLLANNVSNEGTITAVKGKIELVGANEVSINLNGNSLVNLTVNKGILDALVENKGALIANGGEVYLTTNAVNELLRGVVNNTGVIEAKTLDDVAGKITLYAHGGIVNADGTLDASATTSGNGGFIETSGETVNIAKSLHVTTLAAQGKTGKWLIDPVNYTIAASGGNETGAALAGRLAGTNIEIQADNTITVNDAITWSANKLTLNSGGNIYLNADLTATGAATLAFYYGQASADGGSSRYTVADGVNILIPTASAFTWKKGSAGTLTNLILDNGNLRFGNGTEASINDTGALLQPWYYDNVTNGRNGWYKLTYSSYPLDYAIGIGGVATAGWNNNGTIVTTGDYGNPYADIAPLVTNQNLNIAGYYEKTGSIITTTTMNISGIGPITVEDKYTLLPDTSYLKATTTLINNTGSSQSNIRLWVGTRDDWVALSDANYKTKGNITSNGFETITNQTDSSNAIMISEQTLTNGAGAAVLFYSTTAGTNTVTDWCCSLANIIDKNPIDSAITTNREDGSYGIYLNLDTISNSQRGSVTWYYAAGPIAAISNVVEQVGQSSGASTPTPLPSTPLPSTPPSVISAIVNNTAVTQPHVDLPQQQSHVETPSTTRTPLAQGGHTVDVVSSPEAGEATTLVTMAEIREMQTSGASATSETPSSGTTPIRVPLMRGSLIDIVDGGVKLPTGIEQEFYVLDNTKR
ncbi:two-partner secretion domain-containing protein [Sulfurospirillum arsenophilum]|uniref:two-partner secretion domain-containing protein n=1 Tax=Sulfurospirillum arsenophilum TaxID=56698 RepID=UPI000693898C|nr:filamentous hemagglutinin N-terminal domain-containing protein [Sulfurospirillum arsenophilum]